MNKFRKVFDHRMWLYDFARITGSISGFFYLRLKRIYEAGKKPKGIFKGKFLVCPNHSSYLDPLRVMMTIPSRRVGFMIKANKANSKKSVHSLLTKFGCIKVEGTNVEGFKKAIEYFDRGHIVTIFPEASIQKTTIVREYKLGMAMLAYLAGADILPIYIGNRKKWYHREIAIIGNRIKLSNYIKGPFPTMDEIETITKVVHAKEQDLKNIYDKYIAQHYAAKKEKKHESR